MPKSHMMNVSRPDSKKVDTWQLPCALEWDPVSQAPFKDSQDNMISTHYELKIPIEITFIYIKLLPKFRLNPVYNTGIPLPKENSLYHIPINGKPSV